MKLSYFKLIGALTSKPYAFMSRSWDLKHYESIDVLDNFGSNIKIDVYNLKILRVLPKINKFLNEDWITDKIRFSYDGLRKQRLNLPMLRKNKNLISVSWLTVFNQLKMVILNSKIPLESFCGDLVDLETLFLFKKFLAKLGYQSFTNNYFYNNFENLLVCRDFYICSLTEKKLKLLTNLIYIGLNLRLENPLLNLKIRKHVLKSKLKVFNFGFNYNLTYLVTNLGNNIYSLIKFFEGKSYLCQILLKNKLTYLLLGYNSFFRQDLNFFNFILVHLKLFFSNLYGSFFFQGANLLGQFELGLNFVNSNNTYNIFKKNLFLVDMDNINFNKKNYEFIIYQGHHGGLNMYLSDLIFPGVIPYEKEGIYLNLYGLRQMSNFILTPKNFVKNDWKIIKALGDFLQIPLYYNKHIQLLNDLNQIISAKNLYKINNYYSIIRFNNFILFNSPVLNFMGNYYLNNSITRASLVMALCALRFKITTFF